MGDEEDSPSESSNDDVDPRARKPDPITPKMLIKALKLLGKKRFKGLFYTAKDVAAEILKLYPAVEQNFYILLLEVADKLACAAASGLIGSKEDVGYCVYDIRQKGTREDSKSELMFWILYKKLLTQKADKKSRTWIASQEYVNKQMKEFEKMTGSRYVHTRKHPYFLRRGR